MEEKILELFEGKKFTQLKELMLDTNPVDLAAVLENVELHERPKLFRIMPKELASEVFALIDSELQEQLITGFSDSELRAVMSELFLDDTVDIIEEMPANIAKRILKQADKATRNMINQLLNYPEDSAGSIMTTEYIDLKKHNTVMEAFNKIRRVGIDSETINICYVTDAKRHLLGYLTIRTLLLAEPEQMIEELMETSIISAKTLDDREEVVRLFDKYDLLAIPVVDAEQRLIGIVTVDDAIDVLQEEITEDIEKSAAITPGDKPYFKTGVISTFLARVPWLLLLMISATLTGIIISSFENSLSSNVIYGIALTCFMPMIMGTAGNSGSQSSVTIIRALSLGEVEFSDVLRVLWKEIRVSLLCGLTLGIVNFIKVYLVDNLLLGGDYSFLLISVVSITLVITVVMAKFVGSILPILSKKIGLDPAVMASPFITTVVDALSLLVYFKIASILLGI